MKRSANRSADSSAASALLAFLRRADYEPVTQRALLHRMNVPPERRQAVRRLIRELLRDGRVVRRSGGRLAAAAGADRGAPARSSETLGLFVRDERGGRVQPFDRQLDRHLRVPAAFAMGARDRQVVRVELMPAPRSAAAGRAKVLAVLGDLDLPGMDVTVVAERYGLPLQFPKDVREFAESLPKRIGPRAREGRRHFGSPAPVTIDGETAQDFDDAIAVEELAGGALRLYVHIADVAHFVDEGDVLDAEARRRGTSVYFPGRVLPMLPEQLSNDLCSLRPGVDRLVQTAILEIDREGRTRRVEFADGVIRSAARLTYTQVERLLDRGARVSGIPSRVVPMLRLADRLRRRLERRRRRRGSVDVDLPEPQILLDVEGAMTGVRVEPRNRAHRMIEEFMLAANEAVADWLERKGAACLYRIHDAPDPAKVEVLRRFVRVFGFELRVDDGVLQAREVRRLLEQVEGRTEAGIINGMALRTMQQARYATVNSGHFGLAAESYCHFTSPIRRYPDLIVHRSLRETRRGEPSRADGLLATLADACSRLERDAEAAERAVLNWKKVAFIERHVGETFRGVITAVASFGLFVQLDAGLVEGLLRVERLGGEFFEFDDARQALRGTRSGVAYRLGDAIVVRVERVDRVLQRVDLAPADTRARGGQPSSRGGRPTPRRRTRVRPGGRRPR